MSTHEGLLVMQEVQGTLGANYTVRLGETLIGTIACKLNPTLSNIFLDNYLIHVREAKYTPLLAALGAMSARSSQGTGQQSYSHGQSEAFQNNSMMQNTLRTPKRRARNEVRLKIALYFGGLAKQRFANPRGKDAGWTFASAKRSAWAPAGCRWSLQQNPHYFVARNTCVLREQFHFEIALTDQKAKWKKSASI